MAFFWLPIISAMVTLLLSICYVAYVLLWKFEYSRVPSPSSIISYVDGHPDSSLALQDGLSGLLKEYSDSVDYNFMQNQHRKSKLLLAQRLAFISFALLILCIPQWVINFSHNERFDKHCQFKLFHLSKLLRSQNVKCHSPTKTSTTNNEGVATSQFTPNCCSATKHQFYGNGFG